MYHGTFKVDVPTDTFLNTTGWGKGVAVINGNNLGRFWASEGPQVISYSQIHLSCTLLLRAFVDHSICTACFRTIRRKLVAAVRTGRHKQLFWKHMYNILGRTTHLCMEQYNNESRLLRRTTTRAPQLNVSMSYMHISCPDGCSKMYNIHEGSFQ